MSGEHLVLSSTRGGGVRERKEAVDLVKTNLFSLYVKNLEKNKTLVVEKPVMKNVLNNMTEELLDVFENFGREKITDMFTLLFLCLCGLLAKETRPGRQLSELK